MVAVSRLTGHSAGFFSFYTLPPNQAVSPRAQAKINARLDQRPKPKDVPGIILSKSRSLLRHVTPALREPAGRPGESRAARHGPLVQHARDRTHSVSLVVRSPPFLDVVDYKADNWLRCWFSCIDAGAVPVTVAKQVDAGQAFVTTTLLKVRRILRPGGHVAFEVGEVKAGAIRLEDVVVPAGLAAGLEPVLVLVNGQKFRKTAHCGA